MNTSGQDHGTVATACVPPGEVRQWVARELHDSVIQPLTTLLIELEMLKGEQRCHHLLHEQLDHFQATTRVALSGLRHTVSQLRDEPVRDNRFRHWLGQVAAEFSVGHGLAVRVRTRHWPRELSAQASYNLSRIVEEALCNIVRYSRAGRVSISLASLGSHLLLAIHDDGVGCASVSGLVRPGQGMRGMAERALILGGEMRVTSTPGHGTTIRVRVPLERVM